MNIASALLKQVLVLQDSETWSQLRKNYLPSEYHSLYNIISKHTDTYHKLPTIEELSYEIRDGQTKERFLAVSTIDVEADAFFLLECLKNEYAQKELFIELEKFIDRSVSFESAKETVDHLHQIVMDLEEKVEIEDPQESMQRISLFAPDDEIGSYLPLGLNSEYDQDFKFSPRDLILVGGRRGSGKSITCANIANNVFQSGKSAIYFTIEMDSREILQRLCAIATGISPAKLRNKQLSITEWEKVAAWWASRFQDGEREYSKYLEHRSFEKFHHGLKTACELNPVKQLDVVYDASLTLSRIRSELDKKIKSQMDVGVVIVDYINQVKRSAMPGKGGQYDWTEQIEVSKALKSMAQEYEVPFFSPYQIDASGEARFAKGILDAADAAFTLDTWTPEDACISLNCVKMRSGAMTSFTSYMDWNSLKIGPEPALTPKERDSVKTGEEIDDI